MLNTLDVITNIDKEIERQRNEEHCGGYEEPEDNKYHRLTSSDVKTFVTAGKAIITLESGETGARYTYKVEADKPNKNGKYTFWFVSLMTGNDNDNDYTYLGYLKDDLVMRFSDKSCRPSNSKPSKAFSYFMKHINNVPDKLHVYHSCKCGRCGRTLTTPESITRGLGPECAGLV